MSRHDIAITEYELISTKFVQIYMYQEDTIVYEIAKGDN